MRQKLINKLFWGVLLMPFSTLSQVCPNDLVPTTPTSRFTLNGDGTATDNLTGLTWMRCSLG